LCPLFIIAIGEGGSVKAEGFEARVEGFPPSKNNKYGL